MPAAYNSQSAPGGAAVNPVVAPGLALLPPPPNTQLLHLLLSSRSETNFGSFVQQLQLCYLGASFYLISNLSCRENYP